MVLEQDVSVWACLLEPNGPINERFVWTHFFKQNPSEIARNAPKTSFRLDFWKKMSER